MADLAPNVANIAFSNQATLRREYTLGYAGVQGDIVYLNASNQWALADADAPLGTAVGNTVGMLGTAGNTNQPATVCTYDPSLTVGGTLLANGSPVMLSPNAGKMTQNVPATGNYNFFLGQPRSQSVLNFNPTPGGVASV